MRDHKRLQFGRTGRATARAFLDGARRSAAATRTALMAGRTVAARWQRATLELVFPGTCLSCLGEMPKDDMQTGAVPLCGACLDEMEVIDGPTCRQCGAPVPNIGANTEERRADSKPGGCYHCRGRKLWFDETIAAGLYAGRLRELLLRMKRAEGNSLSLAVGELVWKVRGERLADVGVDIVVPIPLHWRRRLAHRTNSAAMLAEIFARRLRRPLSERLLRRRRHTKPQFSLTPPQRWENVRQAFSVRRGDLKAAHVLLVDDILTSGATCSEAARALRKAGAARVTVVVAARAVH